MNEDAEGREWEGTVKGDGSAGKREFDEKYALPKRYILGVSRAFPDDTSGSCSPSLVLKKY